METEYDLLISKTAVVAANGTALIDVGPDAAFERWAIRSSQVNNNGMNTSTLRVYNNASLTQLVEGSYSGKLDTSDTQFDVRQGQRLYYHWTGATPGSICGLTVRGRKFVRGDRGGGV